MNFMTRHFETSTDRERVYAACVDWRHAREYLAEVEADPECVLCGEAYRLCKDGPNVAGAIVAKIMEQPVDSWGPRLLAVLAVTRPGAAWFRELIEECKAMTTSYLKGPIP